MTTKSTNRNDLCGCGSGKKYKKCCLDKENSAGLVENKPDIFQATNAIFTQAEHGDLIGALRNCKTLLEYYPDHPKVLYLTANIMYRCGLQDSSVALLQKAIATDTQNASYYDLL